MKIKSSQRVKARLEMIPLIDVTFLLLSFFIYLSLFMAFQKGIPVVLPEADTTEEVPMKILTITLSARGEVELDGIRASCEGLRDLLLKNVQPGQVEMALIRADREVPYGLVMQVLDAVRTAGIRRVSLEAQRKGG